VRLTTVFNKLLGLQGAWVRAVQFTPHALVVRVEPRARLHRCPSCAYTTAASYDHRECQWRHVALGKWAVCIRARLSRVACPEHGVLTEQVAWAESGSRFTRDFEDLAAWLAREMSISAVTRLLRVAWATVGRIIRRVVDRHLDKTRLDKLYVIGIDEVSYRKGHNYVSLVVNHFTGEPVWMGEGRSRAQVRRFFEGLTVAQRGRIVVVTMDMLAAYIEEVRASIPNAHICFDPFHVVKLANEACAEVRRTEARVRKGTPHAAVLKGSRWTLLRAPEKLKPYEHVRLANVAALNKRVYRGYLLKEELRALYTGSRRSAPTHLASWLAWASRSKLAPFIKLARTVRKYRDGILNAIRFGVSNGRLEGINTKIAVVRRRAYGFHSSAAFMAMIRLCCTHLPIELPT
jgi:transposase